MKKRIISLGVALSMALAMAPAAGAAEVERGGGYDLGEQTFRSDYVEVGVLPNGRFAMHNAEKDAYSGWLLFGYPDAGTSVTLIRVDGQDYLFHQEVERAGTETVVEGTTSVTQATIDGVEVKQILSLAANPYMSGSRETLVSIRYEYTNTTDAPKQVGARILLDTMLEDEDDAPFRINETDVTTETEFVGDDVPQYWQAIDDLKEPTAVADGFLYLNRTEKPDKVQFATGNGMLRDLAGDQIPDWDYRINTGRAIVDDSAVAVQFDPRTVAAGGSGSVVTYYGLGALDSHEDPEEPAGELSVRTMAPATLTGDTDVGGYRNNPFDVTAYVSNVSEEGSFADLRAVLDLSPSNGKLVLDESQSTGVALGAVGPWESKSIKWSIRAIPVAPTEEAEDAGYSILFYEGSRLVKTLTLSIHLEPLEDMTCYRTVHFDLNGGEGTSPADQRVRVGEYCAQPAAPTRSGYSFEGWFANAQCTGTAWFSELNQYKGYPVTEELTLYAGWSKYQEFTYGVDTYKFENSSTYFGCSDYTLSGDYYDLLINDLASGEKQSVLSVMSSGWGGSCFGMSCVLSLTRARRLAPGYFQSGAERLYDLAYPVNSAAVLNLINYYHLMQMTYRTGSARSYWTDETKNCQEIIRCLDESSYPVVVGFNLYDTQGYGLGGHAVVAYGYEKDDESGTYQVKIWDPNEMSGSRRNTLTIRQDTYESLGFARDYIYPWCGDTFIKYAITVESGDYDYKNLQEKLTALGYTSGVQGLSLAGAEEDGYVLTTNYDSFTISGGGESAVVENGVKVSGELDISHGDYLNGIRRQSSSDGEMELMPEELCLVFDVPACREGYTIEPATQRAVVIRDGTLDWGEEISAYKTSLKMVDGSGRCVFAAVDAGDRGAIVLTPAGEVETSGAANDITVARDDFPYSVSIQGAEQGLSVTSSAAGVAVEEAQAPATVTLTVSDGYNQVAFPGVSANGVSVEAGETAGAVALTGTVAQTQTLDHAVIFYTGDASSIPAQSVAHGERAEEPAMAARVGYTFGGWYTSPNCLGNEEWSFADPVEREERLYARWVVDNRYSHTVTFRSREDTVVYTVLDGEKLAQAPEAPEGSVWDLDVSDMEIRSDLLVMASYSGGDQPGGGESDQPSGGETDQPGGGETDQPGGGETGEETGGETGGTTSGGTTSGGTTSGGTTSGGTTSRPSGGSTGSGSSGSGGGSTAKPDSAASGDQDKEETPEATAEEPSAEEESAREQAEIMAGYEDMAKDAWYYEPVAFLCQKGLMKGMSDSSFAPEAPITRAMVMTMLGRLDGEDMSNGPERWYDTAVAWAVSKGISDGSMPEEDITREQLAVMLYRLVGSPAGKGTEQLNSYLDSSEISPWAGEAMAWAVEQGLITGTDYGALKPREGATRAEAAAIFVRYCRMNEG